MNVEVRRVNLANWALRTSPKFTSGVKYQFHQGFDQITDPEIPIALRPLNSIGLLIKEGSGETPLVSDKLRAQTTSFRTGAHLYRKNVFAVGYKCASGLMYCKLH